MGFQVRERIHGLKVPMDAGEKKEKGDISLSDSAMWGGS